MMLGFRRSFIDKSVFYEQCGKCIEDVFGNILFKLQEQGYISENERKYELTPLGHYYQGNISAKFMRSTFDKVSSLKKKMAISMHIVPDALDV